MRQLELFRDMGCRLEEGHVPYKRFLLERVGRHYEETGELDAAALAAPSEAGAGGVSRGPALRAWQSLCMHINQLALHCCGISATGAL